MRTVKFKAQLMIPPYTAISLKMAVVVRNKQNGPKPTIRTLEEVIF